MDTVAIVISDIAIIMIAARVFGRLAQKVGQPPVVGEIVAGIALGPSLLGLLPGHLDHRIFPPAVLPYLSMFAQLGLVLFMFVVGLELDVALIAGRKKVAVTISMCSVALPFVLGSGLGYLLYRTHAHTDHGLVKPLALSLFVGVAMSITAFPVLGRILSDRGMTRTPSGVLALSCAAVDDVVAWSLLALVVAVVQGHGPVGVLRTVVLTAAFAAVMFGPVKTWLRKLNDWHRRVGHLTPEMLGIVLIGLLMPSAVTEMIGIHPIFGAFIFGTAMPRKDAAEFLREILQRLEQVTMLLLLPLFFVVTGLATNASAISTSGLMQLVLVILVAVTGKFAGAFGGARLMRVDRRQAATIGVLMNTRGLTELIVLNVGRQLGVLDQQLFTLLVIMAVATTIMTAPLLRLLHRNRPVDGAPLRLPVSSTTSA